MRLTKTPPQHTHRYSYSRHTPIIIRTSIDQRSSYPSGRSVQLDDGRLYNTPQPSHSLLQIPELGHDLGNQVVMLRDRRDRVDSWIFHLEGGGDASHEDLEDVPLTQAARKQSIHRQQAIPIQSMRGSIHNINSNTDYSWPLQPGPAEQLISGALPMPQDEGWMVRDIAILILVTLAQVVQMYPYGQGLATSVSLANSLHNHRPHSTQVIPQAARSDITVHAAWIAASYPLTQGAFVLVGGRLGAVYGHHRLLMVAAAWWTVFQLVGGFAPSVVVLCVFRALAGVGGGLFTPNAVALLAMNFAPGPRRNLAMSLFGAAVPVGTCLACLFSAILVQLTAWKWSFFFSAILGFFVFALALTAVPADQPLHQTGTLDLVGAYLGLTGLILFNFVWNQAPGIGWSRAYIYILLIVSIGHLISFGFWEANIAKSPLIPVCIWKSHRLSGMLVTIFFCFVSQGIFFWYFSLFGTEVRHYSLIANGANYQPASVLGAAAAFLVAWLLPRMAARRLIAIGASALVLCNILMATAPEDLSYWAMMFPAMSVASFAIALIYPAAQVIATNSVATQDQGIAGSLISILLGYGLSIGIGMAGTVDRYTKRGHGSLVYGHRCAFYFAVALASVGLAGALLLRMPKPAIESWVGDEMKEVVQYDSEQSSPVDEMRPALYAN